MLAKQNPHSNDDNIAFKENGHQYTVAGCDTTISVTRLVHAQFPNFDPDAVITDMMARPTWEKSQYFGMTRQQIKDQWSVSGSTASAAGTVLHADIEKYYNDLPVANDSVEFAYFLAFDEWRTRQGLVPFRTEWTVYDVPHRIAGTIDMCFMKPDGTLAIYDWKRVKAMRRTSFGAKTGTTEECSTVPDSNYWHYSLQLALYKRLLEDHYGFKVTSTVLVVLHPLQSHYEMHTTGSLEQEVTALLMARKGS